MQPRFAFLLAALLSLGADAPATVEVQAKHGKSLRGTIDGLPFLLLRGTHRERGLDHGALLARDILKVFDEGFLPALQRQKPGLWDKEFLPQLASFSWPPRFEAELGGMLEGIRKALPAPADRRLKTLDREISLSDLKALNCLSDLIGTGCSSFSVWGPLTADGKPMIARNTDYTAFPVASLFQILAIEPAEKDLRPTIDLIGPGFVGSGTTMNSDGALLALHDEKGLPGSGSGGWIPRSLALRIAIESARGETAVQDVAEVLRRSKVKVGNNIHVVGTASASVLEWDGNAKEGGVTVRAPDAKNSLICTNHFVARAKREGSGDSAGRFSTLKNGLAAAEAAGRAIDLESAKKMLDSVCKNGGSVTHYSVVAWPAARRWALAVSPQNGVSSTRGRWITVEWDAIFSR